MLRLRHFDGAHYLAGYAVECALKACIAKETRRHEFPDRRRVEASHTHKLAELLRLARLESLLLSRADPDEQLEKRWEVVQSWSEQSRYNIHTADQARAMVEAVDGFMRWIKPYW